MRASDTFARGQRAPSSDSKIDDEAAANRKLALQVLTSQRAISGLPATTKYSGGLPARPRTPSNFRRLPIDGRLRLGSHVIEWKKPLRHTVASPQPQYMAPVMYPMMLMPPSMQHGAERTLTVRLQDAREAVMTKVVATLREFKLLNTQASRAFNRLIFPESMKLLPLWIFAASKSTAMRGGPRDVPVDARIAAVFDFMSASTEEILKLLYPTMHALHTMPEEAGTKDEYGRVILPPRTVLAGERIDARGAYLVDGGALAGRMPEGLGD